MSLLRILVNGDRLLDDWGKLAPGKPRHSTAAREELINHLTQYYDACGTPITVAFRSAGLGNDEDGLPSTAEVEVLYAQGGQTPDQAIDRMARRLQAHGQILIVTNDLGKPSPLRPGAGQLSSCVEFIRTAENAIHDLHHNISAFNEKERAQFQRTY